ncbi:flavin monoamine oxidase family protein [Candidatus Odyssella acanthamoebae]|uniref:Tryptophan 2-monooxygenase n=1 Tax=Candidatus Odyssella acanthamoebae TaxID=91604 RepID=A0A077B121_9PROT|nr:FAD-dependent oxidoreductase [Candidatus Paracaedibacter acanthamoebae]AIK96645.1 hypothetical protein ID47_07820 [Candidatus Paracaedibacter acanthamoebae]
MNPKVQNHIKLLKEKDKGIRKHIYIIGAGMAGLIAAYELKKLGHTVTLLEGSDRAGGRIFTHRFGEGKDAPYGELGAMRVPSVHDYTLHYIREFQLDKKLKHFIGLFENENCLLKIKNTIFKIKDFLATDFLKDQKFGFLKEIVGTFLPDDMAKLINTIDLQDINFSQVKKGSPIFADLIEEFAQALGPKNPSLNLSLQHLLKGLKTQFFYLDGGMDQLPLKIADQLTPHILYNAEVCQITNLNNKAEISLLCNGKSETITCDYVICTIPFAAMRNMNLQNFNSEKLEAIHRLKYINACKILLLCKNRFWQNNYNIHGGTSITDGVVRQIYYPPISPEESGVLLNYTAGKDAGYLSNLPHHQRIVHAKEALGYFHQEIHENDMILSSASMAWDTYKWSKGAFCFTWSNDDLDHPHKENAPSTEAKSKSDLLPWLYKATRQPEGRIFFAGEHCSHDQGWIQGAIISALETVRTIVSH